MHDLYLIQMLRVIVYEKFDFMRFDQLIKTQLRHIQKIISLWKLSFYVHMKPLQHVIGSTKRKEKAFARSRHL